VLQTIEGHLARLVLLEAEQPEFEALRRREKMRVVKRARRLRSG
jgi:hypothetical protein